MFDGIPSRDVRIKALSARCAGHRINIFSKCQFNFDARSMAWFAMLVALS